MRLSGALTTAAVLSTSTYVRSNMLNSTVTENYASDRLKYCSSCGRIPSLPQYKIDRSIAENLGACAARYPVKSKISSRVPKGCRVTLVSVLERHGARYPTKGGGARITTALEKLKSVRNIQDPNLKFISRFQYKFIPEQLVLFGRRQSYVSGQIIRRRYFTLGPRKFIRSTKKPRIIEAARWWRQGFEGRPFNVPISNLPQPDLIIKTKNNSLSPETCTAAENIKPKPGRAVAKRWISFFAPPITKRLNSRLPGANLNDQDIVALIGLCGFDTAAKNGAASPWCKVFTPREFKYYEYMVDLEKYYSNSYGSKYSRSEGVGWVNELLARLTQTPVRDQTTTDRFLDSNWSTFPIGPLAPRVFADFSSDNSIGKLLSAMGILYDRQHLPVGGPIPANRQFFISKVVPFAGSITVERLACPVRGVSGQYVRVLVNDAVIPLQFQACGWIGANFGMCSLKNFVQSQWFARTGGQWMSCFKEGHL